MAPSHVFFKSTITDNQAKNRPNIKKISMATLGFFYKNPYFLMFLKNMIFSSLVVGVQKFNFSKKMPISSRNFVDPKFHNILFSKKHPKNTLKNGKTEILEENPGSSLFFLLVSSGRLNFGILGSKNVVWEEPVKIIIFDPPDFLLENMPFSFSKTCHFPRRKVSFWIINILRRKWY